MPLYTLILLICLLYKSDVTKRFTVYINSVKHINGFDTKQLDGRLDWTVF